MDATMEQFAEPLSGSAFRSFCPVSFSITGQIGKSKAARFCVGIYRHFTEEVDRPAFVVEDLSNCMKDTTTLKGMLDLFRDEYVAQHPEQAQIYQEVFPTTFGGYTANTMLDGHGVMLYERSPEWDEYEDLEVLRVESSFDSAPSELSVQELVWVTERLLRIAEALHAGGMVVDLSQSRYVFSRAYRKLMLLDLNRYCCHIELSEHDVKNSLRQVIHVIDTLCSGMEDSKEVRDFCRIIRKMENFTNAKAGQMRTISTIRKWFIRKFPGADE